MEKKYINLAKEALKSKNYLAGLNSCLAVLESNPNNVVALLMSASAYKHLEKKKEAVAILEKVIVLDPEQPTAWQGLASLLENTDNKEDLEKLLKIYPRLVEICKGDETKISEFLGRLMRVQESLGFYEHLILSAKDRLKLVKKQGNKESLQETYKYLCKGFLAAKKDKLTDLEMVRESFIGGKCEEDPTLCSAYGRLLETREDWVKLHELIVGDRTEEKWKYQHICRLFVENLAWNLDLTLEDKDVQKACDQCEVTGYKLICKGALCFKAKSYVNAKNLFLDGMNREPFESAKQLFYHTLVALGDWPRLITLSKSALETQPDETHKNKWKIRYARGVIYNEEDKILQGSSLNEDTVKKIVGLCEQIPDNMGSSVEAFCYVLLGNPVLALQNLKLKPLAYVDLERSIAHLKMWIAKGELEKAEQMSQQVLQTYDDWRVWMTLADVQLRRKNEKGVESLKRALHLNPECWNGFYHLAETRISGQDYGNALKMLRVALKYRPGSKKLCQSAITVCEELDDVEAEIEILQAYCEKAPDYSAWLRLGIRKIQKSDGSGAVLALQNALRLNPKGGSVWTLLGEAYMIRGSYATASKALLKAAELDPSPLPLCLQGKTLLALGEAEEAEAVFKKGIAKLSETVDNQHFLLAFTEGLAESQYEIATSAINTARIGRAIEFLRYSFGNFANLIHSDASLSTGWSGLAKCAHLLADLKPKEDLEWVADSHQKMAPLDVAIESWKKALSIVPSCCIFLRNLALSYLGKAETATDQEKSNAAVELAVEAAKTSLSINADITDNWVVLGLAAFRKGDFALSQHSYIKALSVDNKNAEAWVGLGVVYLIHDDVVLAHKAFGQAQNVDPLYAPAWVGEGIVAEIAKPDEAMDMFRHSLSIGDTGVRGYSEWVIKFLKTGTKVSPHVLYALEDLHAVSAAEESLEKVAARGQLDLWSTNVYGLLLERQGFIKRAKEAFQNAADQSVEVGSSQAKDAIFANLARTYLQAEEFDEAIANFSMIGEATAFTTCALGLAQYLGEYKEEALSTFESALGWLADIPNTSAQIKNAMAKIQFQSGNVNKAIELLSESMITDPEPTASLCDLILVSVESAEICSLESAVETLKMRISGRAPTDIECLSLVAGLEKQGKSGKTFVLNLLRKWPSSYQLWSSYVIFLSSNTNDPDLPRVARVALRRSELMDGCLKVQDLLKFASINATSRGKIIYQHLLPWIGLPSSSAKC